MPHNLSTTDKIPDQKKDIRINLRKTQKEENDLQSQLKINTGSSIARRLVGKTKGPTNVHTSSNKTHIPNIKCRPERFRNRRLPQSKNIADATRHHCSKRKTSSRGFAPGN